MVSMLLGGLSQLGFHLAQLKKNAGYINNQRSRVCECIPVYHIASKYGLAVYFFKEPIRINLK